MIENGTSRKLGYSFVFALHSNYGHIFSRFDTIHEHDGQTPHDGIGRAYACIVRLKVVLIGSPPKQGISTGEYSF